MARSEQNRGGRGGRRRETRRTNEDTISAGAQDKPRTRGDGWTGASTSRVTLPAGKARRPWSQRGRHQGRSNRSIQGKKGSRGKLEGEKDQEGIGIIRGMLRKGTGEAICYEGDRATRGKGRASGGGEGGYGKRAVEDQEEGASGIGAEELAEKKMSSLKRGGRATAARTRAKYIDRNGG